MTSLKTNPKILLLLICLFFLSASQNEALPQPNSLKNGESFDLKVRLIDVYNRDITLRTTLHVERPFKLIAANGDTINTLCGVLHNPTSGSYPLDLTISEWVSPKDNMKDTTNLKLELGKTWGGGPVDSMIFLRFITLQRHVR